MLLALAAEVAATKMRSIGAAAAVGAEAALGNC